MMTISESIGLVIGAAVFGGVIGALLTAWWLIRMGRLAQERGRSADLCLRWFRAHLTHSRRAAVFVQSFRSLAREPRNSSQFSQRLSEALKAQSAWRDAQIELETTAAELLVLGDSATVKDAHARFAPVTMEKLKHIIEGSEQDLQRLLHDLRHGDDKAAALVCTVIREHDASTGVLSTLAQRTFFAAKTLTRRDGHSHNSRKM